MRTFLLTLLLPLAVACDPAPGGVDDDPIDDPVDDPVVDDDPEPLELFASVSTFSGSLIDGADMCTSEGCTPIEDGELVMDLPEVGAEFDMWVEGEGLVRQHFQMVVTGSVPAIGLIAPSEAESAAVAGIFGVTIDPGKVTVAQAVGKAGVVPTIDDPDAEGPFYLSGAGQPIEGPEGGHFYIFYNVEPGVREITLSDCDEGDGFWGEPSDGRITFELPAGSALGLFTTQCE